MKILLVRHADPDYARDNLTPKGQREAMLLADRLCRLQGVEGWFVSPLGRAQATAQVTLERIGATAETLPWLQEFSGMVKDPETGNTHCAWDWRPRLWKGLPLLADADRWLQEPLMQTGRVAQVWQETVQGVNALLARYGFTPMGPVWRSESNRSGTLVCFCHFGIATAVTAYLMGLPPMLLWQNFCMQPSAVTTLVTEERVKGEVIWRCIGFGDLGHLWAAGEPMSTAGLFAEVNDGFDTTEAREPVIIG